MCVSVCISACQFSILVSSSWLVRLLLSMIVMTTHCERHVQWLSLVATGNVQCFFCCAQGIAWLTLPPLSLQPPSCMPSLLLLFLDLSQAHQRLLSCHMAICFFAVTCWLMIVVLLPRMASHAEPQRQRGWPKLVKSFMSCFFTLAKLCFSTIAYMLIPYRSLLHGIP